MRFIIICISCLLLSGCQTPANIRDIATSSTTDTLLLERNIDFPFKGRLQSAYTLTLMKGRYTPQHESDKGTFYLGPNQAVQAEKGELKMVAKGGIFLPNNTTGEPARIWYYSQTAQRYINGKQVNMVMDEIAKATADDISIEWEVPSAVAQKFINAGPK